jgi:hypothetical protein
MSCPHANLGLHLEACYSNLKPMSYFFTNIRDVFDGRLEMLAQ